MSKNIKGNHKHLTLSDRIFIEQSLNDHMKFNAIAKALEKDPSTISKEVVRSMDIMLWSSVFVTLMAKKYRFMQFELDMVFDTH